MGRLVYSFSEGMLPYVCHFCVLKMHPRIVFINGLVDAILFFLQFLRNIVTKNLMDKVKTK